MSREIMQQALDALKLVYEQADFSNGVTDPTGTMDEGRVVIGGIVSDCIAALKTALAQPEQLFKYTPYGLRSDENGKLSIGEISQREWVGLTDDERSEMIGRIQHDQYTRQRDLINSTQIITEMYLKERNT